MSTSNPPITIPVTLQACYKAWRKARRGKRPSANQLVFDVRWLDNLLALKAQLRAGQWQPKRTVSFIVHHPKTREIHAPYFADRIVHHLLVERLEPLFESVFIHDSYANRTGKGSHAAVDRLQQFMRSLEGRPSGDGWYLQLDIHNFFNSIHRPTLYELLCQRLAKVEQKGKIPPAHALALRSLCHKLLARKVTEYVRDPVAAALLPPHKRLANAPAACGIPVGNLTSQFFANVYLNELDQFVKHTLKCRHYVRYVDDFILLADNAAQLQRWQMQLSDFLQSRLRLRLKDEIRLQPLSQGVDFLGYRVFTAYRRVRPRVVAHCRAKLVAWERQFVRQHSHGIWIRATAQDLAQLQAMLSSYWGHFAHANSVRLRQNLFKQFHWLTVLFSLSVRAELLPRWVLSGVTFAQQHEAMQIGAPKVKCFIQRGYRFYLFRKCLPAWDYRPEQMPALLRYLRRIGIAYCVAKQTGWLRHGTRRREVCEWFFPTPH